MVQTITVSLVAAIVASITSPVVAKNCYPGLNYCGHTLKDIAYFWGYDTQIREQLTLHGIPTTDEYMNHSLFYCTGGPRGAIQFLGVCPAAGREHCKRMKKKNDECSGHREVLCYRRRADGSEGEEIPCDID
ncbi:hypothetical protein CP532_3136 [Ophiocordyceps camponoti-leonardi (nom. inval.)]|nr:hypothetical protein CP532_3136 [Ophiocordyceps camponoti-leonardi (nom. inval.)]